MLVLVQGVQTQDVVLSSLGDHSLIMIAPVSNASRIRPDSVELLSPVKRLLAVLLPRLFRFSAQQYELLKTALSISSNLRELLENIREIGLDNVYAQLLADLLIQNDGSRIEDVLNSRRCVIQAPLEEPFRTVYTLVLAYYLMSKFEKLLSERTVVLYIDHVDDVYDLLLPLRRFRTYVCTCRRVSMLEIFDEVYTQVLNVDKGVITVKISYGGVVPLHPEKKQVTLTFNQDYHADLRLDRVCEEILSILSEVGFMSLQSLRESTAQHLGVSKAEVDHALLKLKNLGLVEVRYLPDGRVLVYPTILGLVKARTSDKTSS